MGPGSTLYFVILAAIAALSLVMSALALCRPNVAGSKPYAAMMAAVAFWSFSYAMEFQFAKAASMLISTKFAFIGIVAVPVFWIWLVLEFTGRTKYLKKGFLAFLFIIPVITLVLIFTNEMHFLFYSSYSVIDSGGRLVFAGEYGPWYIVHTLYSYLLLTCGALFLMKVYLESPEYFRSRILMVLCGVLIPWVGNFLYITGFVPNLMFDITPFFFLLAGIILYLGIFWLPGAEIMPFARNTIIEVMTDGVFVLNRDYVVVDANPAAGKIAGDCEVIGKEISSVLPEINAIAEDCNFKTGTSSVVEIKKDGRCFYYNVVVTHIFENDKDMGHLMIVSDITVQKEAEKEIYFSEQRYKNLYNNINDGILLHNCARKGVIGKIIDANEVALEMLGFPEDELFRMDGDEIQSAIICEHDEDRYHRLKDTGSLKFETNLVKKDYSVIPVFINSRLFYLDNEEVVISLVKDISAEKNMRDLERQSLCQIERNIEQLSILNDHIRNPLAVIVGLCSMNECKESEIIIEESKKIDEIVRKLDMRCLESEKIRQFLSKHYKFTLYSEDEN